MRGVRNLAIALTVLLACAWVARADDKKSGTVTGIVIAKDKNWIEVKADGEEKGRRYVPRWIGGKPADGGGLDRKMLKTIADLKIGSRVRLEWEFEERARAVKIELLRAPKDKP
jgi:hypothetical protein